MTPKVSVIVPNYNHAPFLKDRLDSIFCQEFEDYEVILLDDGSTDGSRDLLQTYQGHPKVAKMVLNERNSGSTFRQWRKGIEVARGKYIWIAESDDVANPGLVGLLVGCLERDSTIGLAYCQSLIINNRGDVVRDNIEHTRKLQSVDWDHEFKLAGHDALVNFFVSKNIVPNASAAVFRRDLISDECMDAIVEYRFAGDWLLWIELLKKSSLYYVPARLNYFRYHEQVSRNMKSFERVARYLEERCKLLHVIEETAGIKQSDMLSGHNKVYKEWKRLAGLGSFASWKGIRLAYRLSKQSPGFWLRVLRLARDRIMTTASR